MKILKIRRLLIAPMFVGLVATYATSSAQAQSQNDAPVPRIVVSGTADVLLAPSKASWLVEIKTTAPTAAAASGDDARLTKLVMEALLNANLAHNEVVGSRLTVGPKWLYDQSTQRQKRAGYEATNSIQIESTQLDKIGTFLDAALGAGATGVSNIEFSAAETASARQRALGDAVENARRDAEVMARAGGGTLGELLLLSTEETNASPGVSLEEIVVTGRERNDGSSSTEIVPKQIKVTARVIAQWQFKSK